MSQFGYDDEDASSSLGQVPVAARSPMSCASGGSGWWSWSPVRV